MTLEVTLVPRLAMDEDTDPASPWDAAVGETP